MRRNAEAEDNEADKHTVHLYILSDVVLLIHRNGGAHTVQDRPIEWHPEAEHCLTCLFSPDKCITGSLKMKLVKRVLRTSLRGNAATVAQICGVCACSECEMAIETFEFTSFIRQL